MFFYFLLYVYETLFIFLYSMYVGTNIIAICIRKCGVTECTYQCNNTVDSFVEAIDKICHSLIAGSVNVIEVDLLECGWNGWQLIAYEFNCVDNVDAIVMLILSMSHLQWPGKCDGIGGASWRAQHQVFDLRCCHIFPLPAVRQKVNGIRNTKTTSRCCFMLRNWSSNCCYCYRCMLYIVYIADQIIWVACSVVV